MILQSLLGTPDLMAALWRLLGLSMLSFAISAAVSVGYRWYFREPIPRGLAALFGIAAVALYLNTVGLLGRVIGTPAGDPLDVTGVGIDLLTLFAAFVATVPGRRFGTGLRSGMTAVAAGRSVDTGVASVLRRAARLSAVELPAADEIEDIADHDPVPEEVKTEIGGKSLLFPRSSPEALRERLVTRLKEDYNVGSVDVDLDDDGTVTYLALGSRLAGIGPTLGPGTCAVAVEADPATDAGPGDVVQVWSVPDAAPPEESAASTPAEGESAPAAETPPVETPAAEEPRRITTAELRATAGETVTLVVDENDAEELSPDRRYRLVTLPVSSGADREFASLLRAADETLGVVPVAAGSALAGVAVGDLDATVVAVRDDSGSLDAIPDRERALAPGDSVYAIGRPDVLRALEDRARAP